MSYGLLEHSLDSTSLGAVTAPSERMALTVFA